MIPNNHSSTSETTSFFSFPPFFPIFNHGSPIFISIPVKSGAIQIKRVVNDGYPLVNQHNHENHYFSWVNQLFLWSFSIAFLYVYQRVLPSIFPWDSGVSPTVPAVFLRPKHRGLRVSQELCQLRGVGSCIFAQPGDE